MRWKGRRQSQNVEDRRGSGGSQRRGGMLGGGIGTIVLVLVALYFGVDPSFLLQGGPLVSNEPAPTQNTAPNPADEPLKQFVGVVLADTEDVWNKVFAAQGKNYQEPRLVLFSGSVRSACGMANSAVGPFYCPGDSQVYIDLSFFHDLKRRFGAPGDFAQAYVVAHEVAHHIQNLLGISEQTQRLKRTLGEKEANAVSVRVELQADCLSGVWANQAERSKSILESGDIEEALGAASAIGDDRLQKQSRGYVTPDSFTHGSSEQRVTWFKRGFESGDMNSCNTFD